MSYLKLITLLAFILSLQCYSFAQVSQLAIKPRYIEGCAEYLSPDECDKCEYRYIKVGKICEYNVDSNNSCCQKFENGRCIKCFEGLFLNNDNGCQERKIIGCLNQTINGCSYCADEYSLQNASCFKKIDGCLKYANINQCKQCQSNYQLNNGLCVLVPMYRYLKLGCSTPFSLNSQNACVVIGCKVLGQFGCLQCKIGYQKQINGGCEAMGSSGCIKVKQNGECLGCSSSYSLQNGYCYPIGCIKKGQRGFCQDCNLAKGFQLTINGDCSIKNCISFQTAGCIKCEIGYQLKNLKCVSMIIRKQQCKFCRITEVLTQSGKCYPKISMCLSYQSNGLCMECHDKYMLNKKKICVQKKEGCLEYDQRQNCTKCSKNYMLGYSYLTRVCAFLTPQMQNQFRGFGMVFDWDKQPAPSSQNLSISTTTTPTSNSNSIPVTRLTPSTPSNPSISSNSSSSPIPSSPPIPSNPTISSAPISSALIPSNSYIPPSTSYSTITSSNLPTSILGCIQYDSKNQCLRCGEHYMRGFDSKGTPGCGLMSVQLQNYYIMKGVINKPITSRPQGTNQGTVGLVQSMMSNRLLTNSFKQNKIYQQTRIQK